VNKYDKKKRIVAWVLIACMGLTLVVSAVMQLISIF